MKQIVLANQKGIALVDDEDYEYLNQFRWYLSNGYAIHSCTVGGRCVTVIMHRIVTLCPRDMVVDHLDENKLNNQKSNLNITTIAGNTNAWTSKRKHIVKRGKGAWVLEEAQ